MKIEYIRYFHYRSRLIVYNHRIHDSYKPDRENSAESKISPWRIISRLLKTGPQRGLHVDLYASYEFSNLRGIPIYPIGHLQWFAN